jgi:hypothetical protein
MRRRERSERLDRSGDDGGAPASAAEHYASVARSVKYVSMRCRTVRARVARRVVPRSHRHRRKRFFCDDFRERHRRSRASGEMPQCGIFAAMCVRSTSRRTSDIAVMRKMRERRNNNARSQRNGTLRTISPFGA